MSTETLIEEIRAIADPRAIKTWAKVGMSPERFLGASITNLRKIAKKAGRNHERAPELWAAPYRDAKMLATMTEEPKKVSREQVENQAIDLDFWDLSDKFCEEVIGKTAFVPEIVEDWQTDENLLRRRPAFVLVKILVKKNKKLKDEYFNNFLPKIEEKLQSEENTAKEGMLLALIGIGSRNEKLLVATRESAGKIGSVQVDYGETSCETPNPLKIWARVYAEKENPKK